MTTNHHAPLLPPPVPAGIERTQSLRDAPRLAQLGFIRFAHGTRAASTWPLRILLGYLTLLALPAWPLLLLPRCAIQLRDPGTTVYVHRDTRGRITAVLAIKATPGPVWTITDHATRHPGTAAGQRLRDQVVPQLVDYADTHGVLVRTTAATKKLAETYQRTVPGLADLGRAWPFGRRLERRPRVATLP